MVDADVIDEAAVAPAVPPFHVYIRDQNGDLVQVTLDPAPSVAVFIQDCMDAFFEGDDEDKPTADQLYLSTVGGRILPKHRCSIVDRGGIQ